MSLRGRNLGPPLLFDGHYKFNKEQLILRCEKTAAETPDFVNLGRGLEIGDAGSTANNKDAQPHTWAELRDFSYWAKDNAHEILTKKWGFNYNRVEITKSWVNRHGKGGWTNYHVHHFVDIVMAAYISAPKDCGDIRLVDPLEYHWAGYPTSQNIKVQHGYPVPVSDGTVLFFPPWIRHGTEQNRSDEDRWVMSFNFQGV
jgi:uncharacterized protein (TIGR02466 family)